MVFAAQIIRIQYFEINLQDLHTNEWQEYFHDSINELDFEHTFFFSTKKSNEKKDVYTAQYGRISKQDFTNFFAIKGNKSLILNSWIFL